MNVKNFIKHPFGIVAIVLIFIVLTVLVGTPYLIERELNKWIVSRGPDRSQTDNVDFNPFTGRFALYNLIHTLSSSLFFLVHHTHSP